MKKETASAIVLTLLIGSVLFSGNIFLVKAQTDIHDLRVVLEAGQKSLGGHHLTFGNSLILNATARAHGIRKTLAVAAALTAVAGVLMPLSSNLYYTLAVVTAFTISYTLIFIALYSRMSDIMGESKVAMTGAIATFKDLGYTIGPLIAAVLMVFVNIQSTLLVMGAAFVLLVPVALLLHD